MRCLSASLSCAPRILPTPAVIDNWFVVMRRVLAEANEETKFLASHSRAVMKKGQYQDFVSYLEGVWSGVRRARSAGKTLDGAKAEVERGLRIRLTPQGITGTSFLELDYVDPPPATLPIAWTPNNVYIPSTPSTVSQFVNAASDIIERLQRLDIEGTLANLNRLMTTTNDRLAAIDAKGLSDRATRTLDRLDTTLAGIDSKKLTDEGSALLAELRETNVELKKMVANPAWQKLPEDAAAAAAKIRDLVADPKLGQTIARMERSLSRVDRILGGGEQDLASTIVNLRQITDNLRDLTEDAKRYPSNLLFGEPPKPLPGRQP